MDHPGELKVGFAPCAYVRTGKSACKMTEIVKLSGQANFAVFGQVIGIHMRDDCIIDGRFEIKKYNPVSRLGYRDYAIIKDYFELRRPDDN